MISSFYTAATAASQIQRGIDVTANNIANVATNGYKPSNPTFSDLIYTKMKAKEDQPQLGHGAMLQETNKVFTQGAPRETNRKLDFCLLDRNTFFKVKTPDGERYTRDGNFHLSTPKSGKSYLVDANENYVLGANGQQITVDPAKIEEESKNFGVGIFAFENVDGLLECGNNLFMETTNSGKAAAAKNPEIKQGYLEGSAANMAQEMTSAIQIQRAFQFNAKMIQVSDEVMQTINSLR